MTISSFKTVATLARAWKNARKPAFWRTQRRQSPGFETPSSQQPVRTVTKSMPRGVAAVLITAACTSIVLAQRPGATGLDETRPLAAAALQHLRGGDLTRAMNSIGTVADASPAGLLADDNGLAAAAGGLHRALVQVDTDERFDLLYAWSMPTESRRTVRLLTTIVPQDAPPRVFGRALGERPHDSTFAVAEINGIRGLFSTGWILVTAAKEIGRLPRLATELESLAADNVPNAEVLLTLVQVANDRANVSELARTLDQSAIVLRESTGQSNEIDAAKLVLAAAALKHEGLRAIAVDMFDSLVKHTYGQQSTRVRPFLCVAHATAMELHRGEPDPKALHRSRLKYWVPMSGKTAALSSAGALDTIWLVYEDHILHLAGAGNDVLFFRYPLIGDFSFQCETQEGGRITTDGGLVYGGLQYQALGGPSQLTVWDADTSHAVQQPCPFVRHTRQPTFNRVSLRSSGAGVEFLSNLHPVWFDNETAGSPWLGLRSFGERRPMFRNLSIKGKPTIPRKVRMSDGNDLRGWQAKYFGESQPPFAPGSIVRPQSPRVDWGLKRGVISTPKRDGSRPGLLRYQRPLMDDESVTYEFYYERGVIEVHPALGRMAFLIEPGGVRVRWITDGGEWTGLAVNNGIVEPFSRRSRPQLKDDAWNSVTLARTDGKVLASLNDTLIYERDIDYGGDLLFGLYLDQTARAARVRNVLMTGEWPETLPEDFVDNPAVVHEDDAAASDLSAINTIFDDGFLAENVRWIRNRGAGMSADEQFDFLARWLLPTPTRPSFRLSGEFTQTDPAPLGGSQTLASHKGGQILSPVFDLLDVAKKLGRLDMFRDRVEQSPLSDDEFQQRSQAALLLLINLELGDREAAEEASDKLLTLVLNSTPTTIREMWPETLVVYRGVHRHAAPDTITEILAAIHSRTQRAPLPGSEVWHSHVAALSNQQRHLWTGGAPQLLKNPVKLKNWIPAFRCTAESRGSGFPQPVWIRQGRQLQHATGHDLDYLFFPSPLRGNFQIEADLGAHGLTQFLAAGQILGLRGDGKGIDSGTFQRGTSIVEIDPPMGVWDPWVRYRAVFRDGLFTAYLDGRIVRTTPLSEHHDPWVAVQGWVRNFSQLRDFRITGKPDVPDSVLLSASRELTGWVAYHDRIGVENPDWRWEEDPESAGQIVGHRHRVLSGAFAESLLRYQRPLIEDGSVEYDFFYKPNETEAHPALDRLALLIQPNGVRVHWITDARFDRTDISPGNALDEANNQRGPARLPLRSNVWNHIKLAIVGEIATVELNGQLVFERELEATNRRTFGLFRYAATELRVRNVVMRGDWPKTVPPVSQQQLADPRIAALDEGLTDLEPVFEHDFARDGLPAKYFAKPVNKPSPVVTTDGLLHTDRSLDGGWAHSLLRPSFQMIGDFDVTASFDSLTMPALHCGCGMAAYIGAEHLEIIRRRGEPKVERAHVTFATRSPDGTFRHAGDYLTSEVLAGSFRLTRRGDTYTALFAEGDSPAFRVIGEHTWKDSAQDPVTLDLRSFAYASGTTQVVWKNFRIAAEELMLLPDQSQRQKAVVFVMNADGSELKQITQAMPAYAWHGSPDWSPDAKRIAFDGWTGNPSTSRVFVVNDDGTDLKDLGIGIMPTFSPKGGQLAFTWSGRGMAIMNVDGTGREVITKEGWGAQWSSNGRWISYGTFNGGGANVAIIDLDTRARRLLLEGDHAIRYSRIDHNMEWSTDATEIVFLGHMRNGKSEVAITSVDGSSKGFRVVTTERVAPDFCWHPDNDRIMISKAGKLFFYDFKSKEVLLLPGQPMDQTNSAGVWSADGRRIVFSGIPKPKPIPWHPAGD